MKNKTNNTKSKFFLLYGDDNINRMDIYMNDGYNTLKAAVTAANKNSSYDGLPSSIVEVTVKTVGKFKASFEKDKLEK